MNPHTFIQRWQSVTQTERATAQSHFLDLCRLLDEPGPVEADPSGDWYSFEKGTTKTGGGKGWADVWKRGCFAWEYKKPGSDRAADRLNRALKQLQQYALALDNPPLLIVSDIQTIHIPAKRGQRGEHYTDRGSILRITEPALRDPLLAEWRTVKAELEQHHHTIERVEAERKQQLEQASARRDKAAADQLNRTTNRHITRTRKRMDERYRAFLERLRRVVVLDAACGSGNFLYVALQTLKDLEVRRRSPRPGHRRDRPAADRTARPLAQPTRMGAPRTGNRPRLPGPDRPGRRTGGQGTEATHPYQPLQPAPRLAGQCPPRAR